MNQNDDHHHSHTHAQPIPASLRSLPIRTAASPQNSSSHAQLDRQSHQHHDLMFLNRSSGQ